jgi:hypothetical protein
MTKIMVVKLSQYESSCVRIVFIEGIQASLEMIFVIHVAVPLLICVSESIQMTLVLAGTVLAKSSMRFLKSGEKNSGHGYIKRKII